MPKNTADPSDKLFLQTHLMVEETLLEFNFNIVSWTTLCFEDALRTKKGTK